MQASTLTTSNDALLGAVRETLRGAERAQLCVAFVSMEGVQLLRPELKELGSRARLLVTTVFRSTSPDALDEAAALGVEVATLNPGGSRTYHPKLYVARRGLSLDAVIGSANMTSGLVGNVEVATRLSGTRRDLALRDAWDWADSVWEHPGVKPWVGGPAGGDSHTQMEPDLWRAIKGFFEPVAVRDRFVQTLGPSPRRNRVTRVLRTGLYVETDRSRDRGTGAQIVPAWMFNVAWTYLRAHGQLTSTHLMNVLHVHRSTAVLAILAQLPGVHVASRRPITLEWVRR